MKGVIAAETSTSITVNSVTWDIQHAAISVDGKAGNAGDLGIGNVVTVTGTYGATVSQAVAESVAETTTLIGTIQSIYVVPSPDLQVVTTLGKIQVLGQLVSVQTDTVVFGSQSPQFPNLQVGDLVAVSTQPVASDLLIATRIDLAPPGTEPMITGVVRMLASSAGQFQVYQLTVDYRSATLTGFPVSGAANGDLVRVDGNLNGAGVFIASQITNLTSSTLPPSGCGAVTRFTSISDFDLDGQKITTTTQTQFNPSADFVMLDEPLCVSGTMEGSVFTATSVSANTSLQEERSMIQGPLEAIDPLQNSLTVAGISVPVLPFAVIRDVLADPNARPTITLSDLHVGDYVRIWPADPPYQYRASSIGTTAVERRAVLPYIFIFGITQESGPFKLWSLSVNSDQQTRFFANIGDSPCSLAAGCDYNTFAATVRRAACCAAGSPWISVEGTYTAPNVLQAKYLSWVGF